MKNLARTSSAFLLCFAGLSTIAAAQSVAPPPDAQAAPAATTDAPAPAEGLVRLPANTPVELEIAGALSSKTSKIDETFAIRLHSAIVIGGRTIVPAGTMGQGQVVHAAKARAMGKAGELILAARYIECGDTRVRLRGFKLGLGSTGEDKIDKVAALTIVVATPFMFMSGGDLIVPPGSLAQARLMSAVDLRVEPAPACASPAAATDPIVPAIAPVPIPPESATATPVPVQAK